MTTAAPNRAELLDRIATAFLFLFVLVLPVSIAATHIAYAAAALAWLVRLALIRKGVLHSSPLDLPILIYLLLCALSATLSPHPELSWGGMRKLNLVFLVLVVAHNIPNLARARQLVAVLLFAGLVGVIWTGWQYAAGIGLRVHRPEYDTPFYRAGIRDNDLVLRVDGRLIRQPQEFLAYLQTRPADVPLRLLVVHGEGDAVEVVVPAAVLPSRTFGTSLDALGMRIERGRPFRATGFYSHYTTYAEVLQLLLALAFGLWLGGARPFALSGLGLAALWLAFAIVLGATLTRAPAMAAAFACLLQVWFHVRRRWVRVALPLALLMAALGVNAAVRQWRGVGLIDPRDASTDYRLLMWRDGLRLIADHPWFGVGMDMIRLYWWKYDLAAYKKYPLRQHFHSTPIQLGVELGLPVLAAWLALMGVYWFLLVRLVGRAREQTDPTLYGLTLGILGGSSGFLASSLVHYNFGDSEPLLLFWFLAGLALALRRHLAAGAS